MMIMILLFCTMQDVYARRYKATKTQTAKDTKSKDKKTKDKKLKIKSWLKALNFYIDISNESRPALAFGTRFNEERCT